jgi:hypothetical protein
MLVKVKKIKFKITEWSWSGVVENACGGGVEVEVEIRILGTLLSTVGRPEPSETLLKLGLADHK